MDVGNSSGVLDGPGAHLVPEMLAYLMLRWTCRLMWLKDRTWTEMLPEMNLATHFVLILLLRVAMLL
jgi:hypothetical protein